MKNLIDNIAPIEVEIEWDNLDGTYTGRKEIDFRNWSYSFNLVIVAKRAIYAGNRWMPPEQDVKVLDTMINDLEVWHNGILLLGNRDNYEKLAIELENNIKITNI